MAVDTDIAADKDLFGKIVSDLQEGVSIGNTDISGTSKYVEDYTEAGFNMDLGHNFLALHFTAEDEAVIRVGLDPTQGSGMVTLDEDGIFIGQLKDNNQLVRVEVTKGDVVTTRVYTLKNVIFATE